MKEELGNEAEGPSHLIYNVSIGRFKKGKLEMFQICINEHILNQWVKEKYTRK